MDLVGYIYVDGSSSGVGTSCSNIPTAHYVHSLSTMTQRCWVRDGFEGCPCPVVPGTLGCGCGGETRWKWSEELVCGKFFPSSDL